MRLIAASSVLCGVCAMLGGAEAPHYYRGLTDVYAANRQDGVGNFVTRDLVLLAYCGAIESSAASREGRIVLPLTRQLVGGLAKRAQTGDNETTKANRLFLAVLQGLLQGTEPTDPKAATEYKRVLASGSAQRSDLVRQTIDYSQFRPRGRYTKSEELSRYFRAVRYAGTVLFYLKDSKATGISAADADALTEQALQLSGWIRVDPTLAVVYRQLDREVESLFGPADDLRLADLGQIKTQGRKTAEVRAELFQIAKKNGRTPHILGGSVDAAQLEAGLSAKEALTGWRLLPLRFTADSAALQELVFDSVTDYLGTDSPFSSGLINGRKVKAFPLGAELLAVLGSKTAAANLLKNGDTNYTGYPEASKRAAAWAAKAEGPMLSVMRALATMDTAQAATAALALWTHYRRANLLYVKQSYTAESKGFQINKPRTAAYLEPATSLYKTLVQQALTLRNDPGIAKLIPMLRTCVEISAAEDAKQALTASQIQFLNQIDLTVLDLARETDRPIVVDVHTNPSSQEVLEEAVGFAVLEAMAMSGADKPASLNGARWSHTEFKQPITKRLTDEEWEKQLYEKHISR